MEGTATTGTQCRSRAVVLRWQAVHGIVDRVENGRASQHVGSAAVRWEVVGWLHSGL